jgi:hypothetical protein
MDKDEVVSKTACSEEDKDPSDTEEEPEEELIQLVYRGEVHHVPYSEVRSFRTRYVGCFPAPSPTKPTALATATTVHPRFN